MYGPIIVDDPERGRADRTGGVLPAAAQTMTLALSDITVCKPAGTNDAADLPARRSRTSSGGAVRAAGAPFPVTLCETRPIDEDGNPSRAVRRR